jgi:hypothetical protein
MNIYKNARLTLKGRELLIERLERDERGILSAPPALPVCRAGPGISRILAQ